MTERWVKEVTKAIPRTAKYLPGDPSVSAIEAAKLLARQHRAMETKIKSVRSVYVKAQAESERVRERSTGKARREAKLDVTHLQVGIGVCDEILAALAKRKGGGGWNHSMN